MRKLLKATMLTSVIALSLNAGTLDECKAAYKAGALDNAEMLCTKAIKESNKNFLASYWLCVTYYNKGEYKKMLPVAQKLEKLAKTLEEYKASYNLQGVAYGYLGDKKQELKYKLKSLEADKKIGDRGEIGKSLYNLGAYYLGIGNLDEAKKYLTEALEYKTDKVLLAATYNSLAVLGDTQKAMEYSQKAMQYAKEGGDFVAYASYSVGLAARHIKLADYEKAKPLLDSALQIARDRGARNVESYALKVLGAWSANQGDKAGAIRYLKQALEISTAIGDASQVADIKASLSKLN